MKLADLRAQGISVRLKDQQKNIGLSPIDKITKKLLHQVAAHKEALIEELKEEWSVTRKPTVPRVGNELESLIPVKIDDEDCGCDTMKRRMNKWGVKGCIENRGEIIEHLEEQANGRIPLARFMGPFPRLAADHLLNKAIAACRFTVVWVYWHGGAASDELRYSMRSAVENLTDAHNFVVCGDKPPWYDGLFIHSPRYGRKHAKKEFGTGRFCKVIDSIVKLERIVASPLVTEHFLWMYDDTFIVKESSVADLSVPRASGRLYDGENPRDRIHRRKWKEERRRTMVALMDRNLPVRNYSTHIPIVYSKEKLQQTFDEFQPRTRARCIESLYMNHHCTHASKTASYLQYAKQPREGFTINPQSTVVNVGGFNRAVQLVIKERFTEATKWEKP